MKSQVYRKAVITACALGLLGFLAGCLDLSVSFEATNPETSSAASTNNMSQSENNVELPIVNATNTSTRVANQTTIPVTQVEENSQFKSILLERQKGTSNSKTPGMLRMSNQTDQPVRLALLARQSSGKGSARSQSSIDIPAHWDFAPQEGSSNGMLLSLPNGSLKLQKGDILVAFAQDGSRRYWGPYVVGETSVPTWNAQTKEWRLVLSP
ncbi:hypothetical protein [Nostoc sp. FACHB-110]|uniref:hypothetical protein n=1 Tax=Nostoc sp. FACHB-110 TaxID=2692834 RepID=UPI001688F122|nr:hypothetical protein [Nostoc sp. FACHB-110]MBD2435710.1 hypothetical protein [Nostoc sp. FACHB-110]